MEIKLYCVHSCSVHLRSVPKLQTILFLLRLLQRGVTIIYQPAHNVFISSRGKEGKCNSPKFSHCISCMLIFLYPSTQWKRYILNREWPVGDVWLSLGGNESVPMSLLRYRELSTLSVNYNLITTFARTVYWTNPYQWKPVPLSVSAGYNVNNTLLCYHYFK